ncbi:MAG: DUF58 domain-containing protein [Verrucomicrobia bacterium]|nr:DUF58 domain-containing protein [Verrucomicrobiota bacterium]
MLVPRTRLLFSTAAVLVPFGGIAALMPDAAVVSFLLMGLFVVLALMDGVLAFGSLDGISVELPKVTRLSKDRAANLDVLIKNERPRSRELRVGLPLPREIPSSQEDITTVLPVSAKLSRVRWACVPVRRGRFRVERCHLEGASPLGLWSVRGVSPVDSELRVYPNLMEERSTVSALFLRRGGFGAHVQRQVGKGREFEKLREYAPGDGFEDIHWKATAKRGHPITKVFQIERTQEVYVIVDASRLSARQEFQGPRFKARASNPPEPPAQRETLNLKPETSVLERYLTAALVLGLAAEQQGDHFGLLTFSDRVHKFIRAKNGPDHYAACRDAIYTLQPRLVSPDFDELATFIRLRMRRRALLIVLTALDDPLLAEQFTRSLDLFSRQHLVLVNMMQPPGAQPLFSDSSVGSLDDVYQRLGGHVLWHNLRELDKTLQRRGVQFTLLENERLCAQLVTNYFSVKRRQLI